MSPAALELTVDGQPVASSTRELAAGPYTVVIATAIPELALRLHSTYIGSEHSDSIVVHLELGLNKDRPLAVRRYPHGELPVVHARHRCLLEHAGHLQQLVADLTEVAPSSAQNPTLSVCRHSIATQPLLTCEITWHGRRLLSEVRRSRRRRSRSGVWRRQPVSRTRFHGDRDERVRRTQ
ncbi:MAG: hypothetical protein M3R46_04430 [Actinomycetota bacterium]|nr:hypothetical protein [Actinomycetota bacterium]